MVIKIVACILAVLIAGLVGWQFYRTNQTYKYASSRECLLQVGKALQHHHQTHGRLGRTITLQGLGGSLPTVDAWGSPIRLDSSDDEFILTSFGSDLQKGGSGSAEDIVVRWKAGQKEIAVQSATITP